MKNIADRWNRAGSIAYILWGILHIVIGLIPVVGFLSQGPAEMFASLPGARQVPATLDEPLLQASYFTAEHHFNLAAFGLLAILVAVRLNWQGDAFGFWLNLVVLGLVDASFIAGQMVPGYMPFWMGISGPILYILGALFTGIGLLSRSTAASMAAGAETAGRH